MKSGDAYRFCLHWPMDTEERILAGEFLNKLGNKKSRFIVQLISEYLNAHPETLDPKETIKLIFNNPTVGGHLTEIIRSIIQTELDGRSLSLQTPDNPDTEQKDTSVDENIGAMFENLDMWTK